ncbi:hypothetical protein N008_05895 [Hymenobacter sp. APR13]|nr:hypothetical protein N008_05895 [Hymenobacter sp. APR13]
MAARRHRQPGPHAWVRLLVAAGFLLRWQPATSSRPSVSEEKLNQSINILIRVTLILFLSVDLPYTDATDSFLL